MPKRIKLFFYVMYMIFIPLVATEIVSRILFPAYANDSEFLEMAFERVLNSKVVSNTHHNDLSKKLGFIYRPNTVENIIGPVPDEYKNSVKINSLGFRGKEINDKRDNEYRVLLLGDSMFFGVGSKDGEDIGSQLEKISEKELKSDLSLSVYNYAVCSYNTVQELIVMKTFDRELQPDHAILGFFIANDIIPNAVAYIDSNGNYDTSNENIFKIKNEIRTRYSIFWYSTIFRIVSLRAYIPRMRYQIAKTSLAIERNYSLLKDFQDYSKENKISFSVLMLYPADGVQGGLVEKWAQSRSVGRLLVDFCKLNNIDVVDMLNFMNGSEDRNRYMFKKDKHFNNYGDRKIAEVIFEEIIKKVPEK